MDELFVVRGVFKRRGQQAASVQYLDGCFTEQEARDAAQVILSRARDGSTFGRDWSKLVKVTVTRETTIVDEEV